MKRRATSTPTAQSTVVKMVTVEITPYDFRGDLLDVVRLPEGLDVGVSLRRLCEAIPVDFASQTVRLARAAAKGARWACVVKITTHDQSGRRQEMLVLPRRSIPMFAATISLGAVREDLRTGITEKLAHYQDECAEALADRFLGPRRGVDAPSIRSAEELSAQLHVLKEMQQIALDLFPAGALEPLRSAAERAPNQEGWLAVLDQMVGLLDQGTLSAIMRHRGWKNAPSKAETLHDALGRHAAGLSNGELCGLFVQLLAFRGARELAERLHVDSKPIDDACLRAARVCMAKGLDKERSWFERTPLDFVKFLQQGAGDR